MGRTGHRYAWMTIATQPARTSPAKRVCTKAKEPHSGPLVAKYAKGSPRPAWKPAALYAGKDWNAKLASNSPRKTNPSRTGICGTWLGTNAPKTPDTKPISRPTRPTRPDY